MQWLNALLFLVLAPSLPLAARQPSEAPRPVVFPAVTAYNLQKEKVTLPAAFEGEVNLLLLSFEREQQKDVDLWLPVAKEVQATHPKLRYYALPVFPRQNMLYRWWMNSSLRSDLPSQENARQTIPIFTNRQRFRHDLEIGSDREITVLLADRAGKVLWRATGPLTAEKKASLLAALGSSGNGQH